MARIQGFRTENQEAVDGEVRRREERRSRSASQVCLHLGSRDYTCRIGHHRRWKRSSFVQRIPGLMMSACAACGGGCDVGAWLGPVAALQLQPRTACQTCTAAYRLDQHGMKLLSVAAWYCSVNGDCSYNCWWNQV